MLQVVFGDSEKGSICMAARFSGGEKSAASFGVILGRENISPQERRRVEAEMRGQWEREQLRGRPLGGDPGDMIGFAPMLDVGDIAGGPFGQKRRELIRRFISQPRRSEDEEAEHSALLYWESCLEDYRKLMERAAEGEAVRVWYSDAPYALCGLYCVLDALRGCPCPVSAVQMPRWHREEGVLARPAAWCDVPAGDWAGYLPLEREVPPAAREALAREWAAHKKENAPLRAVINGQLVGVAEDFYDPLIRREIPCGPFKHALLIGRVLGKYRLGIGDWTISQRILRMVETGELTAIQGEARYYDSLLAKA